MRDSMPASHDISATIAIADFVNVDASGKANLIGAGVSLIGLDPQQGASTPFGLYVRLVSPVPIRDRPAVEIVLVDASGQPVVVPGPTGEPQAMRFSQLVDFPAPAVPGVSIPAGAVPSASQFAINFASGLPLEPGRSYTWRVQIDRDVIASESFYVPHAATRPIFG